MPCFAGYEIPGRILIKARRMADAIMRTDYKHLLKGSTAYCKVETNKFRSSLKICLKTT